MTAFGPGAAAPLDPRLQAILQRAEAQRAAVPASVPLPPAGMPSIGPLPPAQPTPTGQQPDPTGFSRPPAREQLADTLRAAVVSPLADVSDDDLADLAAANKQALVRKTAPRADAAAETQQSTRTAPALELPAGAGRQGGLARLAESAKASARSAKLAGRAIDLQEIQAAEEAEARQMGAELAHVDAERARREFDTAQADLDKRMADYDKFRKDFAAMRLKPNAKLLKDRTAAELGATVALAFGAIAQAYSRSGQNPTQAFADMLIRSADRAIDRDTEEQLQAIDQGRRATDDARRIVEDLRAKFKDDAAVKAALRAESREATLGPYLDAALRSGDQAKILGAQAAAAAMEAAALKDQAIFLQAGQESANRDAAAKSQAALAAAELRLKGLEASRTMPSFNPEFVRTTENTAQMSPEEKKGFSQGLSATRTLDRVVEQLLGTIDKVSSSERAGFDIFKSPEATEFNRLSGEAVNQMNLIGAGFGQALTEYELENIKQRLGNLSQWGADREGLKAALNEVRTELRARLAGAIEERGMLPGPKMQQFLMRTGTGRQASPAAR